MRRTRRRHDWVQLLSSKARATSSLLSSAELWTRSQRELAPSAFSSMRIQQKFASSPKAAGIRCVQLHGHTTPESCSELAREFRVIRALSTDTRFEPEHAAAFPHCDVLIDAYHPELRGGTGQTCDWSAARAAMRYTRFLILSGGLDAQNVGRAIAAVTPHAVDVCSGIESAPGVKDHRALEQFISAVRATSPMTNASSFRS